MPGKNLTIAKAYYLAVNNKNLSAVERYLHPHVHLISPFTHVTGKEQVLEAVKRFMVVFKTLTVQTACGCADQVMLVYDLDCPAPIDFLRAAVLMNFSDDLITRIELFFDTRPFERKA